MKPLLSCLLLWTACASPQLSPQGAPLETTTRALPPVRVSWEEVSRSATEAVVLAKLERVNALAMPFVMTLEVPPGATVVSGRTRLTLLPNAEPVLVTETITFHFEAPPPGDAVLKLDGDSGAMGFHFKVPYRFGRPVHAEQPPAATGPAVKLGDRNLGPSIPLK